MSELTREQIEKRKSFLERLADQDCATEQEAFQLALCNMALSAADAEQRGFREGIEKAVEVVKMEITGQTMFKSGTSAANLRLAFDQSLQVCKRISASIRALSPSDDTVRVPREPTSHMAVSGHVAMENALGITISDGVIPAIYRAMIAEVK